jgi:NAD(P)H-flavin reductase
MFMAAAAEPHAGLEPMVPRRFRVVEKRRETEDTWTLGLEPADPASTIESRPGQFNMVYAFGAGEVPISISGESGTADRLVHTIRAVGATTEAICAAEPNQMLGIRGPFGSSWPLQAARGMDVLVIAGGIGLAPLRPVLYALMADPESFGNASLLYGGREPKQLLFREELDRWRDRPELDVQVTVDIATAEWRGRVGVVTGLIDQATFDPSRAAAFVCGPEVMMHFAIDALLERGVGAERIYLSVERNMKCAVGHCGHCQFGPEFVCRDGPVFSFDRIDRLFNMREV